MRQKKAVSEIISAIIIITVVVSAMGLYVSTSQQRVIGDTISVKEAIDLSKDGISENIEYVGKSVIVGNDEFSVFVHNYGLKDITLSKIYVNGVEVISSSVTFTLGDIDTSLKIKKDTTNRIRINVSQITSITDISEVVLVTKSNKIFDLPVS